MMITKEAILQTIDWILARGGLSDEFIDLLLEIVELVEDNRLDEAKDAFWRLLAE